MVLSLYLNLDPSEFPTPRDRSVELESLLDVAEERSARTVSSTARRNSSSATSRKSAGTSPRTSMRAERAGS